jgi:DNA-binding response OmpR family regulator
MSGKHVLIVDDEPDIRSLTRAQLELAGYRVSDAPNGRSGLRTFHADTPDLVILDITMPEMDGWEALERIRDVSSVPVIMLTARAAEADRVRGLRAGADDYVAKPFGRRELIARVEAVLRRAGTATPQSTTYGDDWVRVDFVQRLVWRGGQEIHLAPLEFRLLAALVRSAGRVVPHEDLLQEVWQTTAGVMPEQVRLYVSYLRRKLGGGETDSPIETIRGVGYRYRPPGGSD